MRHHDQTGAPCQLLEGFGCLLLESGIARGRDLIRDIDVEIEGQRQRELQPRSHPGRIGFDRFVEVVSQLGKIGNSLQTIDHVIFMTVDTADEFGVLPPAQRALQAATEPYGPGNPAMPLDAPSIGMVDTPDQTQQGGFPRAILADQAYAHAWRNPEIDTLEHPGAQTVIRAIALVYILDQDH